MTITNPHAWAIGTVDKSGRFTVDYLALTRKDARAGKCDGEVVRKVFIQLAEQVRRTR